MYGVVHRLFGKREPSGSFKKKKKKFDKEILEIFPGEEYAALRKQIRSLAEVLKVDEEYRVYEMYEEREWLDEKEEIVHSNLTKIQIPYIT